MTNDTPTPAMTAERLADILSEVARDEERGYVYEGTTKALRTHIDALDAKVAQLERAGYFVNEERLLALEEAATLKRSLASAIEIAERQTARVAELDLTLKDHATYGCRLQAEKERAAHCASIASERAARIEELEAQLKEAREALKFYADRHDGGKRARAALQPQGDAKP